MKKLLVVIASVALLFSGMAFAPSKAKGAQGDSPVGKCTLTIYKKNLGPDNSVSATGDCARDVEGWYWGPQSNNYMMSGAYHGIVKDGDKITVFIPRYGDYEVTVNLPDAPRAKFKSFKGLMSSNVDVRATSKSNSKVIGKLKKSQTVTVVGGSYKSVYKIKYGKGYGYVLAKYVKQ